MELALEGERLCQSGELKNGVKFFEEAIKVGTNDDRTLSAIYSQLGNAYFYLEDYQKAREYHEEDVKLVHSIGDKAAEAKACGNLGNTFKMLGKFDEAAVYCRRYLEISRELQDTVGEGRALYNLGNVYHMQGKKMIGSSEQESGELPKDIKSSLQRAIEYYEANLKVVSQPKDHVAMGRAYGNLGNTQYLLGNFEAAVESHKKRLELAKQTNDKSAERRAHLNLGNANVFLGKFPEAIENYSATLKLAQELNDKHTEAHSCYSLANTFTFLRDYNSAISYHLKYLDLIVELEDKLGEGRACWSLVNIYQMVNDPESALTFAKRHYEIAELLGDETGLSSAKANIEELEETISQKQAVQLTRGSYSSTSASLCEQTQDSKLASMATLQTNKKHSESHVRLSPDKRQEQEQRRFKKQLNSNLAADIDGFAARRKGRGDRGVVRSSSSERLFDMIAHFQSGRIDDQRCEILNNPILPRDTAGKSAPPPRAFADDKENDDGAIGTNGASRASQSSITNPLNAVSAAASAIKATYRKASLVAYPASNAPSIQSQRRPTVSAEHREQLFDLIASHQGQRMDEQRASLPALTLANGILKNPINAGLLSRGHTVDQSHQMVKQVGCKPETIPESINQGVQSRASEVAVNMPQRQKAHKLTRHFQTVDSDVQVHDEKFLDSLMKYQSTRFNDQRSELPNKNRNVADKEQSDKIFNMLVRLQSDRIDDQRSEPPQRSKNV